MAGVIMEDGTQYERCNCCGEWVDIMYLAYGTITPEMADEADAKAKAWAEEPRPLVTCEMCAGTGTRPDGVERFGQAWSDACGGCNVCHGEGTHLEGGSRGWHPVDRTAKFDLCPDCADRAGGHPIVGPAAAFTFHDDGTVEGRSLQ